jgi:hypothetical protein
VPRRPRTAATQPTDPGTKRLPNSLTYSAETLRMVANLRIRKVRRSMPSGLHPKVGSGLMFTVSFRPRHRYVALSEGPKREHQ